LETAKKGKRIDLGPSEQKAVNHEGARILAMKPSRKPGLAKPQSSLGRRECDGFPKKREMTPEARQKGKIYGEKGAGKKKCGCGQLRGRTTTVLLSKTEQTKGPGGRGKVTCPRTSWALKVRG